MSISFDDTSERRVIRLADQIDVSCSADLKQCLMEPLVAGKAVHVDLDAAADFDVTALQLIWAAAREAERAGVSFEVGATNIEKLLQTASEVGWTGFAAGIVSGGMPRVAVSSAECVQ